MRSRLLWLLMSAVLLAALLVKVARSGDAARWFASLAALWPSLALTPGPLFIMALVPLAVVLVLLVLCLDGTPPRDSAGDLERLVELKERIAHRPRPRRIRESAARTSRRTSAAGGGTGEGLAAPAPAGDVLEHLLQLKRRGVWTPHLPPPSDDAPARPAS